MDNLDSSLLILIDLGAITVIDAKLRFLSSPKDKKFPRKAIFELPPHKRTLLISNPINYSIKPYFVQFPYLVFTFPYVGRYKRLSLELSDDDHYSKVSVYTKAEPLTNLINQVGTFNDYTYVCFGKDVDIYGPERNIQSLFLKISNLFFETVFTPYFFHYKNLKEWETQSRTSNILYPAVWNYPCVILNTKSTPIETWKYFP